MCIEVKRMRRWGCLTVLLMGLAVVAAHGATWFPLGPYGGDARSFGSDPSDSRHIYLGTTTGWIYDSHDGGATWARVARLGTEDDLYIRHILVDPKNPKRLLVAAWKIDRPDGGIFISDNGGKSWYAQAQMRGQSVRSLARSPSDPDVLAAGTLQGVFLSKDNGLHWNQISPVGSTELHEVESLAFDPADPNVIYAGTWHLPWKTTDGGATWTNMTHEQGIIDDSAVFSIIVDPNHPERLLGHLQEPECWPDVPPEQGHSEHGPPHTPVAAGSHGARHGLRGHHGRPVSHKRCGRDLRADARRCDHQ